MVALLNVFGVATSAIGSVVLWYFIVELNFFSKEHFLKGEAVLDLSDPVDKEIARYNSNRKMSKLGIALILVGGLLQIAASLIPVLAPR